MRRSNPKLVTYLFQAFILFGLYTFFGFLGLSFDAVGGFASFIWFPTGIALVSLFLYGSRLWPAILLAAFTVNIFSGASAPAALGIASGNTLEAVVGAFLLKKSLFNPNLEKISDVLKLIFYAAIVSTLISATVGTVSVMFGMYAQLHPFFWLTWWIGDMTSNLLVAPVLLTWRRFPTRPRVLNRAIEVCALFIVAVILSLLIFDSIFSNIVSSQNSPIHYLLFPVIIWAALRFSTRVNTALILLLSCISVWGTAHGYGPFFRDGQLSESFYLLQSFMGVLAVTSLTLTALTHEKRLYERRKDDFIAMASHELKTPLTSLKVYAQMLKKTDSQRVTTKYAIMLDGQIDRLNLLVNDLLDVSRVHAQKFELNKTRFSLDYLVREMITEVQATTKHRIAFKNPSHIYVYADKERIGQVIVNLLSNSVKYSPDTRAIYLELHKHSNMVEVAVKDKGIGISSEDQKQIFELFFRAQSSDARFPGLGVGLYLSRLIIHRHGGSMSVKSSKGKGTTVAFTLPVERSYSR